MPLSSLIPAMIGSMIESAADQPAPRPVMPAPTVISVGRSIPADALFGEMVSPMLGMTVQINGVVRPLAMAAQFRNEQDIAIMPGRIQRPVMVRYLVDSTGTVYRVWILSPAELAASGAR